MYYLIYIFFAILLSMVCLPGTAQEIKVSGQIPDTTALKPLPPADTIPPLPTDTIPQADSTLTEEPSGDLQTTVDYNAEDSIHFDVVNQKVYLYGNAKITYGEIMLEAEEIEIDWVGNMITARGGVDSTGKPMGQPIFTDGPEKFETEAIRYNFKTRKAFINGVVTQQDEGMVYGKTVKKNEKDEVFIRDGWYTPCDCEPGEIPDLYIKSDKMKLTRGLVVTGPFHLVITDVPTPLGLPFGIFPKPQRQNSGIIVPAYGEERRRGFFLRDGGYYFDINEYVNLTLLGEIYTKGSFGFTVRSQYSKRYAYSGNLNFRFNQQNQAPDSSDPDNVVKDFSLAYNHTPASVGKNSRFSASVNIATSSYNQNNPTGNVDDNLRTTLSSSAQYSVNFPGTPFNMAISARHNQNLITEVVSVSLPDFSMNMNSITPFQGKNSSGGGNVFQRIRIGWNMVGTNRITNTPVSTPGGIPSDKIINRDPEADSTIAFNFDNLPQLLERAQNGIRHSIPISTNFNLLRYFTVSPSFNYEEVWYFKKLDYKFVPDSNKVAITTVNGFNRVYEYSMGAGLSTRLYGTYFFKGEKVQAMRHTIVPTISFGYRPDFGDTTKYGYYQEVPIDTAKNIDPRFGNDQNKRLLSHYDGFVYGTPSAGRSGSLGFSLNNQWELKVRNDNDTTENAEPTKKVPILENLSLSTSYNFIADSFRLAPINISARTRLFDNKINIAASATVDPYAYIVRDSTVKNEEVFVNSIKMDQYAWEAGQGLGHLTSANLNISTSLNPKANKDKESDKYTEEELEYINTHRDQYVDWEVPWNVSLTYRIGYSRDLRQSSEEESFFDRITANSLQFNGDLSLTEKWKINFSSGYDLKRKEFTMTSIDIRRDLGCFEMSFNWIPFGRFTSFHFQVNVKSSLLRDLKLQRRNSFYDQF